MARLRSCPNGRRFSYEKGLGDTVWYIVLVKPEDNNAVEELDIKDKVGVGLSESDARFYQGVIERYAGWFM